MASDRPNYFDLLELDPDEPWIPDGEAHYRAQLDAKRARWANLLGAPGKTGEDAKRYLDMRKNGEIQDVMEDSGLREAEARDCREGRRTKQARLHATLDKWKKNSSVYTKNQIASWASLTEMTPAEVEAAARAAGLTLADNSAAPPAAKRTSPTTMSDIRAKLEALARLDTKRARSYQTLYTFLGLDDTASAAELVAAAQRIYKEEQTINRAEAIPTKRIELTGQALNIFKTDESQDLYDAALRFEPLEQLLDVMSKELGGEQPPDSYITAYYEDALKAGFTQDEARAELDERAKARGWRAPTALKPSKLCPFCDRLIDASSEICPRCGHRLLLDCPNCDRTGISADAMACPHCGFPTGQFAVVEDILKDANTALGQGDYAAAERMVREARAIWSPKKPDDLDRRLSQFQAELDEQRDKGARDAKVTQALDLLNQAGDAIDRGDTETGRLRMEDVIRAGVASEPAVSEQLGRVRTRQAQQLLNKAEGLTRSGKFDEAQKLIDQVRAMDVGDPQAITRRIAELGVLKCGSILDRAESAARNSRWDDAEARLVEARSLPEASQPLLQTRIARLEEQLKPHLDVIRQEREKVAAREAAEREAARAAAAARQAADAATLKSIQLSIGGRNFHAARQRLPLLSDEGRQQPNAVEAARQIDEGMRQAGALVSQARALPDTATKERVTLCLRALAICQDHPDANDLLQRTPPPPPTAVTCAVSAPNARAMVTVRWKASTEEGVTYSVVCKEGASPQSPMDGAIKQSGSAATEYEDTYPLVGVKLYYAVFAKRALGDSYSAPATPSSPVILTAEVSDAKAEPGDRSVALTWTVPEYANRATITVRRREGSIPPASLTDGDAVRLSSPVSVQDNGLTNGKVYSYRIFCVFADADQASSAGVVVRTLPHARPAPPPSLRITNRFNTVHWCEVDMQWGEEAKEARKSGLGAGGVVERRAVYHTNRASPFKKGERFSVRDARLHFEVELDVQNGHARESLPQPGLITYVPAIVVHHDKDRRDDDLDWVYTGDPQVCRCIPELEQPEAHSAIGAVQVTWIWPYGITEAVIAPGGSLPADPLTAPGAAVVKRIGAEDRHPHDVPAKAGRKQLVTLAALIHEGGRVIAGPARVVEGQAAEPGAIEYEFVPPSGGFLRQKNQRHTLRMRVRSAGPLTNLPPLIVCWKEGAAPTSPNDGQEWNRYETQPLSRSDYTIELPPLTRPHKGLYGAVFFADEQHARQAQLLLNGQERGSQERARLF